MRGLFLLQSVCVALATAQSSTPANATTLPSSTSVVSGGNSSTSATNAATAATAVAQIKMNNVVADFQFVQLNNSISINGSISGLTNVTKQYAYHVHLFPVPTDGNCNATGLHLDPKHKNPNGNSTTYKCLPSSPDTCEAGDLSGKHGKINGTDGNMATAVSYVDSGLNVLGNDNNVAGRAIVIHNPDGTRLACANISVLGVKSSADHLSLFSLCPFTIFTMVAYLNY